MANLLLVVTIEQQVDGTLIVFRRFDMRVQACGVIASDDRVPGCALGITTGEEMPRQLGRCVDALAADAFDGLCDASVQSAALKWLLLVERLLHEGVDETVATTVRSLLLLDQLRLDRRIQVRAAPRPRAHRWR